MIFVTKICYNVTIFTKKTKKERCFVALESLKNIFWSEAFLDRNYTELNPLNYGYHECPPHHTGYGMRNYFMIHYVESGSGTLKKEKKIYHIMKGQIFIICPGENVSYTADDETPWTYRWIGFNGRLAKKLETLENPILNADYTPFSMLASLSERQDTKEEMGAAILFLIFSDILSGKATKPHYVRRTVDTVNSLYMTSLSVEKLAKNVGLDRRYLSRIFKKTMGISIQDYIIDVRMKEAQKLLQDGKGVAITAGLVGYTDVFNFSKMFKKYYGQSPRAFAKTAR